MILSSSSTSMMATKPKVILIGISGPSSSGKTTLSQLLAKLFPGSLLLHEDDYYKNDAEIPLDEILGEQNWDSPDAINMDLLCHHLSELKEDPANKSFLTVHSIQPNYEIPIPESVEKQAVEKIKAVIGDDKSVQLVFLDGFLLYHENSPFFDLLDIKLFIRVKFDILKMRRESRAGYKTKDSFWVDPPGYYEKLVYPNYVRNHKYLFKNEDVDSDELVGVKAESINVFTISDEQTGIDEVFKWGVDVVLNQIKKLMS